MERDSRLLIGDTALPVQTIDRELGRLTIVGQCLSPPEEIAALGDRALQSGDAQCMQTLLGSFSVVMEAAQSGQVAVSTDVSNQHPVFWSNAGGSPRLSLTAGALGSEPNPVYLAAMFGCKDETLIKGLTAYQGVYSIEGGQAAHYAPGKDLVVSAGNVIVPDYKLAFEDAAMALRGELLLAIQARMLLGQVVTADCSGGLDSTGIALLAAAMRQDVLQAVILDSLFAMTADVPFARQIVAGNPHIHLNEVEVTETALPFYALHDVDLHDQPDPASGINARIRTKLRALKELGSQLHFTGDGGDAVLDSPPNYLTDLARLGLYDELRSSAIAWGRLRYLAPRDLERDAFRNAARTISHDLHRLVRKFRNPELQTARLTWFDWPSQGLRILSKQARLQLAERASEVAETINVPEGMGMADYVSLQGLQQGGILHSHLREIAATEGIATHAPYMDTRVAKACLQLPAYLRADRRGQFKKLLGAFAGQLPDALLARSSKGNYASEAYKGLRRNRKAVEALLLHDSRLEAMGLTETKAVREAIRRQAGGLQTELQILDRLVAAEVWLRRKGW